MELTSGFRTCILSSFMPTLSRNNSRRQKTVAVKVHLVHVVNRGPVRPIRKIAKAKPDSTASSDFCCPRFVPTTSRLEMTSDMAFECLLLSRDPSVVCTVNKLLENLSISTNIYLTASRVLDQLSEGSPD